MNTFAYEVFTCFAHVTHHCIPVKYYSLDVVTSFLEKLKTTAVVRNDYGFTLGWGCNFFGNHLIMFGLFFDELMGQYR